jgi:hypothetical protein
MDRMNSALQGSIEDFHRGIMQPKDQFTSATDALKKGSEML